MHGLYLITANVDPIMSDLECIAEVDHGFCNHALARTPVVQHHRRSPAAPVRRPQAHGNPGRTPAGLPLAGSRLPAAAPPGWGVKRFTPPAWLRPQVSWHRQGD